jgi:hypothetical protein
VRIIFLFFLLEEDAKGTNTKKKKLEAEGNEIIIMYKSFSCE